MPIFRCAECGKIPRFLEIAVTETQVAPNWYGMDERVTRLWVPENSDPKWLGDAPLPEERRNGSFTHVRYITDCQCEDECACEGNESMTWILEDCVANFMDATPTAA